MLATERRNEVLGYRSGQNGRAEREKSRAGEEEMRRRTNGADSASLLRAAAAPRRRILALSLPQFQNRTHSTIQSQLLSSNLQPNCPISILPHSDNHHTIIRNQGRGRGRADSQGCCKRWRRKARPLRGLGIHDAWLRGRIH